MLSDSESISLTAHSLCILVDKWVNIKSTPDSTKKIINNTKCLYVRSILHARYDMYMCIYGPYIPITEKYAQT